jgi:hypothetical protein
MFFSEEKNQKTFIFARVSCYRALAGDMRRLIGAMLDFVHPTDSLYPARDQMFAPAQN